MAFTWKQNVSQLLALWKTIFAETVQDTLLLIKFAWRLLTDDVSHVYQKWVMPEVNIALHFLLKT